MKFVKEILFETNWYFHHDFQLHFAVFILPLLTIVWLSIAIARGRFEPKTEKQFHDNHRELVVHE